MLSTRFFFALSSSISFLICCFNSSRLLNFFSSLKKLTNSTFISAWYKSAENDVNAYEEIAALLKEGKVEDAQRRLDDCNERGAEWHYLQAVVYYKKNWTNDSKKQLEIAIEMEPSNQKYRAAYGKLNARNEQQQQQNQQV